MISNFLYAIAGGVSVSIFTMILPHWFGLVSQAQYDDTLQTLREEQARVENYQDMLTQSQNLTQRALEELGRRAKALEYLRMRLYYVEKYLEQTKKPKAQSSMAAGQILVDRSL